MVGEGERDEGFHERYAAHYWGRDDEDGRYGWVSGEEGGPG